MPTAYENEEVPLPLLRPARPKAEVVAYPAEDVEDVRSVRRDFRSVPYDRMRPATAGAMMGAVAGAAGLAVVHAMHLTPVSDTIVRTAAAWEIPSDAAFPLAYAAAAIAGALVGSMFAIITRHLRRFVPLVLWALVFFTCLAMMLLALSTTNGRGMLVSMAPGILLASAAYGLVASFQLPLRRRSVAHDEHLFEGS